MTYQQSKDFDNNLDKAIDNTESKVSGEDPNELTLEEQATNAETLKHIRRVQQLLNGVIKEIIDRGEKHDLSKLEKPEVEIFTKFTPKLAKSEYGSEEYDNNKKAMGAAIEHHYEHNRHHPEHHENGIDDMNLVDLIEMICDWKAATERHKTGDINNSIKVNKDRFKIDDQLTKILQNSIPLVQND